MSEEVKSVVQFLQTHAPDESRKSLIEENLKKEFYFAKTKSKKKKLKKKCTTFLNRKEKKELNFYTIPSKSVKYKDMVVLNSMWKEYAQSLLELERNKSLTPLCKNWDTLSQSVFKMDLHGCLLVVVESKCPNYVGKRGICILETKETFKIVCEDDTNYTIPKKVCVFEVEIDDVKFSFLGSSFCYRPAERAVKKIKSLQKFEL